MTVVQMSRKNKRDERVIELKVDERLDDTAPKPKRYTPPDCSLCQSSRPKNRSYTHVTHTVRETGFIVRYCKCDFCGNTFKQSEKA